MMIVTPVKMQNALIARREDVLPMKKARQSVSEVIVMDGPACLIASLIRLLAGRSNGVWSTALQITNISSTPIPKMRIMIVFVISVIFQPNKKQNP